MKGYTSIVYFSTWKISWWKILFWNYYWNYLLGSNKTRFNLLLEHNNKILQKVIAILLCKFCKIYITEYTVW